MYGTHAQFSGRRAHCLGSAMCICSGNPWSSTLYYVLDTTLSARSIMALFTPTFSMKVGIYMCRTIQSVLYYIKQD